MLIELDVFGTLTAASLVLLAGRKLVASWKVLNTYSIPEPVVGGLAVALLLWLLHATAAIQVGFDKTLGPPLMLAFFACIGLNADLPSLLRGGRPLVVLLAVVVGFLVLQNLTGIGLAMLLGQSPLVGLLAGSISLSGGHGTGAAWSAVFTERYQLAGAKEIAIASATFGLVLGGVIGGPVARHLLGKVRVKPGADSAHQEPTLFEHPAEVRLITAPALIETLALISVCLLVGQQIARALAGTFMELPAFVCVLFVGVILRNGLAAAGKYTVFERAVSVLGNVSLALFLALALMSMRLWELSSLALPMLVLLLGQTALMAAYAIFVTFPVMGRNYDAAVIAAGHCGFGLGATPTAIANMQAVTDRFGNSPLAFLVVPMVGAFFIDLANALVIKLFLMLPLY
ncbi:MAG: sodium/glutamate symporter [Burkholderiaceae bacterium]|jgi:ESS family glutamate:Na+ symporter